MSDKLPYFLELEDELEPLPIDEWFDELLWTPSQCYYRLQHNETDYILYLRWRWTDPWQAYVVKNAFSLATMNRVDVVWSSDVFEGHRIYFNDVELARAKERFVNLFYEFDGDFTHLGLLQENTDGMKITIKEISFSPQYVASL